MKILSRTGRASALLLGLVIGLGAAASAFAAQEEMVDALKSLKAAKVHLERGLYNKGGHRVKALQSVNEAISEVQQGIEYARAHPDEAPNKKK